MHFAANLLRAIAVHICPVDACMTKHLQLCSTMSHLPWTCQAVATLHDVLHTVRCLHVSGPGDSAHLSKPDSSDLWSLDLQLGSLLATSWQAQHSLHALPAPCWASECASAKRCVTELTTQQPQRTSHTYLQLRVVKQQVNTSLLVLTRPMEVFHLQPALPHQRASH